jgi:hypothetical protein
MDVQLLIGMMGVKNNQSNFLYLDRFFLSGQMNGFSVGFGHKTFSAHTRWQN